MNITNAWFKFHHCNMFQNIFAYVIYLHPGNIQNIRKCHDFKIIQNRKFLWSERRNAFEMTTGTFLSSRLKLLRIKVLQETPNRPGWYSREIMWFQTTLEEFI